jgi:hypothetical protein
LSSKPSEDSTPRHDRLFESYVKDLRTSKTFAEAWWKKLHDSAPQEHQERKPIELRWPDGPASHPRVIAVIQKYHRACEELNDLDDENAVPPTVFLVEWLMEDETEELADFLANLSYWPIGLDENDEVI